jgi:hypothetical protein
MWCILSSMATLKAKTLEELEAQKQALKEKAAAEIAPSRKLLRTKQPQSRLVSVVSVLRASKNRSGRMTTQRFWSVWPPSGNRNSRHSRWRSSRNFCQSFTKTRRKNSPPLNYGLSLIVKRPESDSQQDDL